MQGSEQYKRQYQEQEGKKNEVEERVAYVFAKKKRITQGGWVGAQG